MENYYPLGYLPPQITGESYLSHPDGMVTPRYKESQWSSEVNWDESAIAPEEYAAWIASWQQ